MTGVGGFAGLHTKYARESAAPRRSGRGEDEGPVLVLSLHLWKKKGGKLLQATESIRSVPGGYVLF